MSLAEQVATVNFGSIANAGSGLRSLALPRDQLGPALAEALALSPTRGLRAARGLVETAADTDEAANDMGALVEWSARAGKQERLVVADALRLSNAEVLLVDRVSRLPRAEARPFITDWLEAGGDPRAIASWLAVVGEVLLEHQGARPAPDTSGAVITWIKEAAEDVVDAITEAVETIVDAVLEAGRALADVLAEVVNWTIQQIGNLLEALLEAGRTVGQLIADAVEAGATMFRKLVQALLEIGRTVGDVLAEVISQAAGMLSDAISALRSIAVSFANIIRAAASLVAAAFRQVVQTLISIGRSIVQILGDALEAAASVLRSTLEALLAIGRTVGSLIADVVTGRRSLIDAFTRAMRDIGRTISDLLNAARTAVAGAVRSITRSLASIGETIADLAQWAAGAATAFAREVIAALVEIGRTVADLMTAVAQRASAVVRTVIDGLYAIGRTFGQLLRDLASVASDILQKFLEAAFSLGATIVEFVKETVRNTYESGKRLVEAAIRAGAAVADLLVEAARGTYFTLRRIVYGMADLVGVGDIVRWAVANLEGAFDNIVHQVMTALRYAGRVLTEALDWAAQQTAEAFRAVVDGWESVGESLLSLYQWASGVAANLADRVWEWIGNATSRLRNSVTYVLNYLENDFLPGVRRFVRGLLDAAYEVGWLLIRVLGRAAQFVGEVVRELLELGSTIAELLVVAVTRPAEARDALLRALREIGSTWGSIMAAARDAGDAIVDDVIATARRLEQPLQEMLAGALEVGGGFLGLVVSKLFNLLATYRPLTQQEKDAAAPVFGASINLDEVGISAESLDNDIIFGIQEMFSGSPSSRAFVTGTLINMNASRPIDTPTLIHELTHVWQNFATGPMYLSEAIHAQIVNDDAYDYGYTNRDNGDGAEAVMATADGNFASFNREEQGQVVMHYYVRRYEEARPEADWADWRKCIDYLQAA